MSVLDNAFVNTLLNKSEIYLYGFRIFLLLTIICAIIFFVTFFVLIFRFFLFYFLKKKIPYINQETLGLCVIVLFGLTIVFGALTWWNNYMYKYSKLRPKIKNF